MNVRAIRFHLSLKASNAHFAESVRFYEQLFGTAPSKLKPGYAKFDVGTPDVNLTLNAVEHVETDEIDHLGIQVWSDEQLVAARTRILSQGLQVRDENEVECCYAGQNKFWITDPDGRNVEFFHVLHDIERHGKRPDADAAMDAQAAACCTPASASACCTPAAEAAGIKTSSKGCCA
ncbi:MAG: VOC family protein [Sandaracinaceae bacterium]|nr:VOC family protein [Sandaracinaceae bacterium]